MAKPEEVPSKIDGVKIFALYNEVNEDDRGSLLEIARIDWVRPSSIAMAYVSRTNPGVTRGPHKHEKQTDWFYFMPGTKCQIGLVDDRPKSLTRGAVQLIGIQEDDSYSVFVPPGVIHWYKNLSEHCTMTVINLPNKLYRGMHYKEEPDEVRYED